VLSEYSHSRAEIMGADDRTCASMIIHISSYSLTIDIRRGLIHACCMLSSRYRFAIRAMFSCGSFFDTADTVGGTTTLALFLKRKRIVYDCEAGWSISRRARARGVCAIGDEANSSGQTGSSRLSLRSNEEDAASIMI